MFLERKEDKALKFTKLALSYLCINFFFLMKDMHYGTKYFQITDRYEKLKLEVTFQAKK